MYNDNLTPAVELIQSSSLHTIYIHFASTFHLTKVVWSKQILTSQHSELNEVILYEYGNRDVLVEMMGAMEAKSCSTAKTRKWAKINSNGQIDIDGAVTEAPKNSDDGGRCRPIGD